MFKPRLLCVSLLNFALVLLGVASLTLCGCQASTCSSSRSGHAADVDSAFVAKLTDTKKKSQPVKVLPTQADKLLIEKFDAAMIEFDQGIAREIFNHYRGNKDLAALHDAMAAGEPVNGGQLVWARTYFQTQIDAANISRNWPPAVAYTIARATGPVTIDGKLDEVQWQETKALPLLYTFNDPSLQASDATARMLWDDDYLYVAYRVPDRDIQTPELQNDDPLTCTYDCVELFIMPDKQWGLYWEINASPNGAVYDALNLYRPNAWMSYRRIDLNIKGLRIKNSNLSSDDGGPGYVVELAFPLDQLPLAGGRALEAGDTFWGLVGISQLNMVDGKRKHLFLSHSPMLGNFHNIQTLAPFKLAP